MKDWDNPRPYRAPADPDVVDPLALKYRVAPEVVREVAGAYAATPDVHQVASDLGLPWATVHLLIFDLRRAGVLPRRSRRRAA